MIRFHTAHLFVAAGLIVLAGYIIGKAFGFWP